MNDLSNNRSTEIRIMSWFSLYVSKKFKMFLDIVKEISYY